MLKIWSSNRPRKEGFYWFNGHLFGEERTTLTIIEVIELGNGFIYHYHGEDVGYETSGFWQEIDKPETII